MPTISIRDLSRHPNRVVHAVVRTGRPAIITHHRPAVTAMVALDPDGLEDWVLSQAPEFLLARAAAE